MRRLVARVLRICAQWTYTLARRLFALAARLDPGHPVLGGRAAPPARRLPWQQSPPPSHWARRVLRDAPLLLQRRRPATAPAAVATIGGGRPVDVATDDRAVEGTGAVTRAVVAGVPAPVGEAAADRPRPALPSDPRPVATRADARTESPVGGLVAPTLDRPGEPSSVTATPYRSRPLHGGGSAADRPAPAWPRPPEWTDAPPRSTGTRGGPGPYPSLPDDSPLWMDVAEEVDADQVDVEHLERLEREQRGQAWSG